MASDPLDIRPQVLRKSGAMAPWVMAGIAVIGAGVLFAMLDANRRSISAPATRAPMMAQDRAGSSIPDLEVPVARPMPYRALPYEPQFLPDARTVSQLDREGEERQAARRQRSRDSDVSAYPRVPQDAWSPPSSGVVYEAPSPTSNATAPPADPNSPISGPQRVEAGHLLHPTQTVTQGSVIQGVLETALDTTRTGLARAIVSRDVRGFDGAQVLIPRGSRLIGEYQSDVAAGQNRALIRWTRLIRPDGVTIAIQSPSADTLGRAGVRGKVHTHFLERYSGAILQSALDVGVGLATQSVTNGAVILGWPGGGGASGARTATGSDVRATVTVRQGASVSVFVARDLDFFGAGAAR